jgi:hypothetical protein
MLMTIIQRRRGRKHHDLCREHAAAGDYSKLILRGETAANVWWEIVETKAAPIPGTTRCHYRPIAGLEWNLDDEVI